MKAIQRYARSNNRLFKHLLLVITLIALQWNLPGLLTGKTDQQGNLPLAAAASDPVIAAAGDIACDPANSAFNNGSGNSTSCRPKYTSNLLVNAGLSAVLDLGDNQYYCGSFQAYMQSYNLSWGRVKSITHPSVGNHEYLTNGGTSASTGCDTTNTNAAGYFQYFGAAAGTPGQGYYSFDVGTWHLIALNSNCSNAGGCSPSSPQYKWLQADLAAHPNFCTLAFWHIPLYSSGGRASANSQSFWQLLYNNNADLIINGHDHIYERFAPQNPTAGLDLARGIREFIVGTGGSDHTTITNIAANSELRNATTYGVIKLTLHATSYDWQFVPEAGKTFTDSGSQACHGSAPVPTPMPTLTSAPAGTNTPTPTPTPTSTLAATNTPTQTPTPTTTASVTNTPTQTATPTFIPTDNQAVTNTPTQTSTLTTTPAVTDTPTLLFTPTATFAMTGTPTQTPTLTITLAVTDTPTLEFTPSATLAVTDTPTQTPTLTTTSAMTDTPTLTPIPTITLAATNTPTPTFTPTPTTPAGQSFTFNPVADTYVDSANPTVNNGSKTTIRADGSPDVHSFLRFTVTGLGVGTITRVRLLVFAISSLSQGIKAQAVADNTWGELTTTYANAPALGTVLASSTGISTGTWVTLDVTSYITGNGTYSFAITDPSPTAISLASRESGTNAPQLIIDIH